MNDRTIASRSAALERIDFLRTMDEISRRFSGVRDISDVGRAIDEVVEEIAPIELAGFYLLDHDSGRLRLVHQRGFATEAEIAAAEASAWERHSGEVIRSGTILDVPDCEDDAEQRTTSSPRSSNVRSRLYVPVYDQGRVIGTFGLGSSVRHAFGPLHVATLHFLSNVAGQAYRRIEADVGIRRREAILAAVAAGAELLLGEGLSPERIQRMLARLGEATAASRVYVFENFVGDDGTTFARQVHEWAGPGVSPEIDNPDLHAIPYIDAGYGRWVDALTRNEAIAGNVCDFPASERALLEAQGIVSMVLVPVLIGEDWWGLIGFDECRVERVWSSTEVDALKAAARVLGAAIQRDRAERELKRQSEDRALLLDHIETQVWYLRDERTYGSINRAHAALLGRSPEDVEGRTMGCFLTREEAEVCERYNRAVFESRRRVQSQEWVSDARGVRRLLSVVKTPKLRDDGSVEYVVASAEDITEQHRMRRELEQAHAELEARVEQRTVELRDANGRLEAEIAERCRMEAQIRAHGGQLSRLATELTLAEERERRRIAIGVHDRIGQTLALCRMNVSGALSGLRGHPAAVPLGVADRLLDEVMRDTRTLTFELSLPILYELGLVPALEWLAEQMEDKGVPCEVSSVGARRELAIDTRVVLFQVARELLTNVERHSGARSARLHVAHEPDRVTLHVRDDGRGFDWPTPAGSRADGYGLFSVRERIEALGGVFMIETAPGKGTTVDLSLPIPSDSLAAELT